LCNLEDVDKGQRSRDFAHSLSRKSFTIGIVFAIYIG
jgi:hypothetical protein